MSFRSVSAVPLWAVSCLLRLDVIPECVCCPSMGCILSAEVGNEAVCLHPWSCGKTGSALTAVHLKLRSSLKKIFIWFWQNKQKLQTPKRPKTKEHTNLSYTLHIKSFGLSSLCFDFHREH